MGPTGMGSIREALKEGSSTTSPSSLPMSRPVYDPHAWPSPGADAEDRGSWVQKLGDVAGKLGDAFAGKQRSSRPTSARFSRSGVAAMGPDGALAPPPAAATAAGASDSEAAARRAVQQAQMREPPIVPLPMVIATPGRDQEAGMVSPGRPWAPKLAWPAKMQGHFKAAAKSAKQGLRSAKQAITVRVRGKGTPKAAWAEGEGAHRRAAKHAGSVRARVQGAMDEFEWEHDKVGYGVCEAHEGEQQWQWRGAQWEEGVAGVGAQRGVGSGWSWWCPGSRKFLKVGV